MSSKQIKTHPIEKESMRIIEEKVDLSVFNHYEAEVAKRVIHTTGDLEIHKDIKFSDTAIVNGLKAMKQGSHIYTDVTMVTAGLNKTHLTDLGSNVYCEIDKKEVQAKAKAYQKTRSETAIELFGNKLHNQIVAIGNAPTALYKVLELHTKEHITPALVIGVPVGFVGAKESKENLRQSGIPYITIAGYKGGSPIAACVVNALIRLLKCE